MRVVFVNRFYRPETPATGQLLADLAEAIARCDTATIVTRLHGLASTRSSAPSARAREFALAHDAARGTSRWARLLETLQAC